MSPWPRTDDRIGVAQQQWVVHDSPAVRRDRNSHRAETARGTAPTLALSDEVDLIVRHLLDHTQGV